jgi:hypothetical protein
MIPFLHNKERRMEALEMSNRVLLEEIMHAHAEIKGLRKQVSRHNLFSNE